MILSFSITACLRFLVIRNISAKCVSKEELDKGLFCHEIETRAALQRSLYPYHLYVIKVFAPSCHDCCTRGDGFKIETDPYNHKFYCYDDVLRAIFTQKNI